MWNRFSSQVAQGAILLDGFCFNWFDRIDTCRLCMNSPFEDILGQLFGEYEHGTTALFGLTRHKSYRHGFCLINPTPLDWNELREAWLDAILLRRAQVACPSWN